MGSGTAGTQVALWYRMPSMSQCGLLQFLILHIAAWFCFTCNISSGPSKETGINSCPQTQSQSFCGSPSRGSLSSYGCLVRFFSTERSSRQHHVPTQEDFPPRGTDESHPNTQAHVHRNWPLQKQLWNPNATYLWVDVQNTGSPSLDDLEDGINLGSIEISFIFPVLQIFPSFNVCFHLRSWHKFIRLAVIFIFSGFSWSNWTEAW